MAWSDIFKSAVCTKLEINDDDERMKPFYRDLTDEDFIKIYNIFNRILGWQIWISPRNSEIDNMISNDKTTLKDWFREKGLTAGFLLGAEL
jgi:hypothetical protein